MISKACIVGAYQRKLEALAALPDMNLTVLAPPSWRDSRGQQHLERVFTHGYELRQTPLALNGHFHLHFYPRLAAEVRSLQPDLLHVDEEPYNLATRQALGLARKLGIPALFFTWQNLRRRYPPPFAWFERFAFAHAALALAGNQAAAAVLRAKGFAKPVRVIPQFGVDPDLFAPAEAPPAARPFTIGYAGGFVPEKGLDTLLHACAGLEGPWRLRLVGSGSQQPALAALAADLGIAGRVEWLAKRSSTDMPPFYHSLHVLVLPSRTQRNWMEQFGRVLVEAMACGVPVVGSDSGEIPHVIGEAGLIFPEGEAAALAGQLQRLAADAALAADLRRRGRERVWARFTQAQVARETYAAYQALLAPAQLDSVRPLA